VGVFFWNTVYIVSLQGDLHSVTVDPETADATFGSHYVANIKVATSLVIIIIINYYYYYYYYCANERWLCFFKSGMCVGLRCYVYLLTGAEQPCISRWTPTVWPRHYVCGTCLAVLSSVQRSINNSMSQRHEPEIASFDCTPSSTQPTEKRAQCHPLISTDHSDASSSI